MAESKSRFVSKAERDGEAVQKSGSGFESSGFLKQLEAVASQASQQKLEDMKAVLHKIYARRFKGRCRTPKYGSINKGFMEMELRQFLLAVKHGKFRLLFKYQAHLGLRIGEACALHISSLDFEKREVTLEKFKHHKIIRVALISN
jgi:integrase